MSLALYRKYRPGTLDELIGQDHVVEPLRRALANDRVHHAYLFSGPRGCGKTSSARILARSLNCVQGPTPDPCGVCNSCVDLAPNGSGSIDVIELDAATHGLVDDARDLREKAMYAPAASKYKIYIIDEAHQLGPGAANALLKLIEEPPPHLRFVFATTEPEKIIGTIRSRTHHYGFRLVPARTLQTHLAGICESEGLHADPTALALVAKTAGGSVRDSLSILGQLLAGSGPQGLTYEEAAAQLGITDSALLADFVTALAKCEGAALFRLVDVVIEAGHDPRRFVADLLDRLRDLLIVSKVPDAAEAGLVDGPAERVAELIEEAGLFGPGELSRCAEVVSAGLADLKGATAPRLQLELLVARVILPGGRAGSDSLTARVERLERDAAAAPRNTGSTAGSTPATGHAHAGPPPRLSDVVAHAASVPVSAALSADQPSSVDPQAATQASDPASAPAAAAQQPPTPARSSMSTASAIRQAGNRSGPPPRLSQVTQAAGRGSPEPDLTPGSEPTPDPKPVSEPDSPRPQATIDQVRALWPAVLDEVRAGSRVAWMLVVDAEPLSVEDGLITAVHADPGTVNRFAQSGHDKGIDAALSTVVGLPLNLVLTGSGAAMNTSTGRATTGRTGPGGHSDAKTPASQESEVVDSTDAEDLASIELIEREFGATKIDEFEGG